MPELTKILNTGMLDIGYSVHSANMQICYCKRYGVWPDINIYAMEPF